MRPNVPDDLRRYVNRFVHNAYHLGSSPWSAQYAIGPLSRFTPDVVHFAYQSSELRRQGIPQIAARFRDDGPNGEILLVIVRAPDLQNLTQSYRSALDTLEATGFEQEEVSADMADQIFIDRLAEFIAVADGFGSASSQTQTIVNSKRKGDTVIYCQGYFTSTATGFGVSTPAVRVLSAGRYSFGILRKNGQHDFENILWTCPATVKLNKP